MEISRNKVISYVQASIDTVKETTTRPWHKHEWQKKQSATYIKENEAFLDKFESRPGEVDEILEASQAKMKKRTFWSGAAAVAGLGLAAATGILGAAAIGPPMLGLGLFAASNVLWLGGVASANLINRGEEKFAGKLNAFKSDIRQDKSPGVLSGRYYESSSVRSRSDDDDGFMSLNMNSRGQVGLDLGFGQQVGFDGKLHSSF